MKFSFTSRCPVFALILLASMLLHPGVAPAASATAVWIEGESPSSVTPAEVKPDVTDEGAPQYLSGGKWLHISVKAADMDKAVPQGILVSYQVNCPATASYEIWGRMGFQASRPAFDWRIDGQDWATVAPGAPFVQLQQLQTWCDVSWMHLGDQNLMAGAHTLDFRIQKSVDAKGKPTDINFACDAICLSAGPFHPNDRYQPGDASWQTDADRAAGEKVFDISAPTGIAQTATTLSGDWQMARFDEDVVHDPDAPIAALPDLTTLAWKAIAVPGGRDSAHPEWLYAHRYLLRTRVNAPSSLGGRSFVLHFPALNMLATVFVNGKQCGFEDTPLAAWDCDVTKAIAPGRVNEIVVGIKDWYYALPDIGAKDGQTIRYIPTDWVTRFGPASFIYPVWNHEDSGILRTPSLVVGGPVYTSDVFCQPSLKNKALTLGITLHNGADSPIAVQVVSEVAPLEGGPVELRFAPVSYIVPANQDVVESVSQPWPNPKLWWPDDPRQYVVTTALSADGKPIDSRTTKFGFREWSWDGDNFKLNGIAYHGRADTSSFGGKLDDNWLAKYHADGQTMIRVWNESATVDNDLDWYDAHGVNVRRTGIFDGEMARYHLDTPGLWGHYRAQIAAWIKGQRNHPSIFIWSIENEVTFINGHVFGQDQLTTDQHRLSAPIVAATDPTRPYMVDGGNALLDESFPVYGGHYMEPSFASLPDGAYDRDALAHRQVWPVTQHKPILLGEAFYWNGDDPGDFATTGGEAAFVGKAEAAPAIGLTGKMLSEGYRWNDINFHFWGADTSNLYYNSWQPTAVLCRQWDSTFGSGQAVPRTLKIFNDGHVSSPITLKWTLTFDGKTAASGSRTYTVAPGANQVDTVILPMPAAPSRLDGDWALTLSRDGSPVFTDSKPLSVLPRARLTVASAGTNVATGNGGALAVFDPTGAVQTFLKARGAPFQSVSALEEAPVDARVLVVGADSLTRAQASSSDLAAYASTGRTVIVLEQRYPLKFQALPGAMETSDDTGEIAFAEDLDNPIFAGLNQSDFFAWGADGVVYRGAYRKPTAGGLSLVQCGFRLQDCALAEMNPGKGLMLLSQLTIGERLASDAVAQNLLINMISAGLRYKQIIRPVTVWASSSPILTRTLDAIGVKYDRGDGALQSIAHLGGIAVIDATPSTLAQLASAPAQVAAFTQAGGWIVLNNVTPDGIVAYDKLVGVDHIIRRFGQNATQAAWFGAKHIEKVTFARVPSPLLAGLSASDVVFNSGKQIFGFMAGQFPDEDGYSYVVDIDDVSPFATSPWGSFGNVTNGYTQEDGFWPLIINFPAPKDGSPFQLPISLARPETLTRFSYAQDLNYLTTTKISLLFDGADKQSFDVLPTGDVQSFVLNPPRRASAVTLEIDDWLRDPSKAANLGLDNIWLYAQRPADFASKVKPLVNIGAMVEYPRGAGGIVLCNVKFKDSEAYPENIGKKQTIIATLLRNMDAPFAGGKSVIAGSSNMTYAPIDISKAVNQYKNEQGWFGDKQFTFADLPGGTQRYAGVPYNVYNFTTSPVPTVVMLGGNGIPGALPDHVNGIPVGCKADALFFLQAARIDRPLNDDEIKRGKQPEIADYIVHYADGKTEKVPILLGGTIDDYHQQTPADLSGAQIAWARPYAAGGLNAVAYSQQWNNPRTNEPIDSIDLVYGPDRRGVPALLAITAATAR